MTNEAVNYQTHHFVELSLKTDKFSLNRYLQWEVEQQHYWYMEPLVPFQTYWLIAHWERHKKEAVGVTKTNL